MSDGEGRGSAVGYARVSTGDQRLDLQHDALSAAGCVRIFEDEASGAKAERPQLAAATDYLRSGDTLVVWRLDRLGRSLRDLIDIVSGLEARGVGFMSLQEGIDTTTNGGRLIFHIFGALAEFERNLIRERTAAGLAAARARGRKGGRPKKLTLKQEALVRELYVGGTRSVREIAALVGLSRSGVYRYLANGSADGDSLPRVATTTFGK
jgi:DNA invertase Pin-like site-specific DNA recombinase